MKTIFSVALVATLFASTFASATTQTIDCKFANPSDRDHILVSLMTEQNGNFMYASGGNESDGSQTDRLDLNRIPASTTDQALFQAVEMAPDNVTKISFTFTLPAAAILKAVPTFKAKLATEIRSLKTSEGQDLLCSAKLN